MQEEPWHLKAALEVGGRVTPLTLKGKAYGHRVDPASCAPYYIHFGTTQGKVKATIHKDSPGQVRQIAHVERGGTIKVIVSGLMRIREIEHLKGVSRSQIRLKQFPELIQALELARAALKKHAGGE